MNNKKKVPFFASKGLTIHDSNFNFKNLIHKELEKGEKIDFNKYGISLTLYIYYNKKVEILYVIEELTGMAVGKGWNKSEALRNTLYNMKTHKDEAMDIINKARERYKKLAWIGVDLDGTLAQHSNSVFSIGKPIKKMVDRVKEWHKEEITVKIVTARVSMNKIMSIESNIVPTKRFVEKQVKMISLWCQEHLGFIPEITDKKDFNMVQLWDDKAVTVNPKTGAIIKAIEAKF